MAELTTLGLWVIGILVAIRGLGWFLTMQQLLKLELTAWPQRMLRDEEVPAAQRMFLEAGAAALESKGFVRLGWLAARGLTDPSDAAERISLCLFHPSTGTYALLGPAETLDALEPYAVTFRAWLADGGWLMGINGLEWSLIGRLAGTEVIDPYAESFERQWSHFGEHLARRASSGVRTPDLAQLAAEIGAHSRQILESLEREHALAPSPDGSTYVFRTAAAAKTALRMVHQSKKARELALRRARAGRSGRGKAASVEIPIELQIATYRRAEIQRTRRTTRQRWGLILGLTGVAFALSMLHLFEAATVAIVVAVVFFHELGHWLAMRLLGYRDATIFFIPFFGGAAVGQKAETSLAEELLVLFAGPVPGLILATAIHYLVPSLATSERGAELVVMLLAINAANLLPLYPLDGGRILDALLLTRRPYAGTIFRAAAGALFLGGGAMSGDFLLILLGTITWLSLPQAVRAARLERDLLTARANPENASRPALEIIFERVRALGLDRTAFAHRQLLVRQVAERFGRVPSTATWTTAWLTTYVALLGGGLAVSLDVITGGRATPGSTQPLIECDEEVAAATTLALRESASAERAFVFATCEGAEPEAERALHHALQRSPLGLDGAPPHVQVVLDPEGGLTTFGEFDRPLDSVPAFVTHLCKGGCSRVRLSLAARPAPPD
ncbi:MAG: hypothetical protein IT384_34335 [Deltaproteobacteria bacterium]|nr:hypothetical protein [Deltaproteobacteria bacterium]